jgi:hypothetical protein
MLAGLSYTMSWVKVFLIPAIGDYMTASTVDLTADIYDFWGHRIGIKSNSKEILAHFRSVYSRFHRGDQAKDKRMEDHRAETTLCTIEVIDRIAERHELTVNDGKEFYSLRCKTLYEFDQAYYGTGSIPDPIAFVTYLFLKNKYKLVKGHHLFHAAAVARNSRAVILPAPEGLGKTTLSVQLVKTGFQFLSDEIACIDPVRQMVEPYPRKLNINSSSCTMLGITNVSESSLRRSGNNGTEWAIDIEEILPGSLSPPCPLAHIVFLQGFGETPRLEYVSPSNALFRLFKYSFSPAAKSAALFYQFTPLMDRVTCHNLVCGNLEETARLVAQLADGRIVE